MKRTASISISTQPCKKQAIKQTPYLTSMDLANVLPNILGFLDRVSLQRFTSTCTKFREFAPRNFESEHIDPEIEILPLDMLKIHILDVASKDYEELEEKFGNYKNVKYLRVEGTTLIGDDYDDQTTLECGLLDIRDFFTELISLELVKYHICFTLTIDDNNFKKLKILRLTKCFYNDRRNKINIGFPLQDIGLYFRTKKIKGVYFEDGAEVPLLEMPKDVECRDWHGNCRVEIQRDEFLSNEFKGLTKRKW